MTAALLGVLALSLPSDWTLFQGPPGGPGSVVIVDEQGAVTAVPELEGVVLIDVEFVGRTRLERFLPDRPRREALGTAARLVLPQQQGSLYRYRRDTPTGALFGLFRVTSDGSAEPLIERAGTGASGTDDPFTAKLACAPDGATLLLATTLAAGGNLLELDLASGSVLDRTAHVGPIAWARDGLWLADDWAVALAADGAWRFDRMPGVQAELVPGSDAFAWIDSGAVLSRDGARAGFIAGDAPDAARVQSFGRSGGLAATGAPLQALDGVGFLPESAGGPWLALSFDGTAAGYRTREPKPEGGLSRETWMASIDAPASGVHLTSDASFLDTMDEVGIIRFLPSGDLVFAAGEPDDRGQGVDKFDFYRASAAGGPTVNLSLSSGVAVEPFDMQASLKAEDGLFQVPGSELVLLHDSEGGNGQVLLVGTTVGSAAVLVPDTKSLDDIVWTGQGFVVSLRRDDDQVRWRELLSLSPSSGIQSLVTLPDEASFPALSAGPGKQVGVVVAFGPARWLVRALPDLGAIALLTPLPVPWDANLVWSGFDLRATVGGFWHVGWPLGGAPVLAPTPPLPSMLLPGL